ncbi:hypothetical protein GC089_12780 [Cellulomonas sp. JZ18]|uniref:hypothetical protein n=1 Tax=Cellulomonas sp. JZ18 TaxID=2654191 RepID=UPI0012D3BF30|nr:hypothetical protein [Cellulomonas sp. JZ18]QGQ19931.1 hypothetical protein GC089_12780 [Cellulomonas sp. JZ18]
MSRLLRAELARARARPAVWVVAGLVLLGVLGLVVTAWWETRPPSTTERAEARVAYEAAAADWRETGDEQLRACRDAQRSLPPGDPGAYDCALLEPVPERFLPLRPGLWQLLEERVETTGTVLALGALLVGASLVAAEFASGAVATWLTFAPRRGHVFASKVAAAVLVSVPVVVAAFVVLAGLLAAVAHLRGVETFPPGVPETAWTDVLGRAGRWAVVAVGAALLGAGLGFALRHVGAVLGVVVWWAAAVESALRLVWPAAGWLPLSVNLAAWTWGSSGYGVPACRPDPAAPGLEVCEEVWHVVGAGQGAAVAGTLVVLALVLGLVSFRRRDVP